MSRISLTTAVIIVSLVAAAQAIGGDWKRFRGPNGSGVSPEKKPLPVRWNDQANVKWKVALPGPGHSCPIVVGKKVFVTCWSGYGLDKSEPGDQKDLRLHLLCLDRDTGKTLWSRVVEPYLPEDEYGGMFAEHGYASHTPVSDGENVYVYFGKTGALAFDMNGKQLWQTQVGTESDPHDWGSASSPILHGNHLIVTATAECEGLVALDKRTGKEVWRQEAAGLNGTWGTPVLVKVDDQRTDLVIAVPGEIWGLDPDTGKLRWFCNAFRTSSFCASVVAKDGIVYACESGPAGGGGIAVRAGGTHDVSDTHVLWVGRQANRIGTPVIHGDRLYAFSGGRLSCYDIENGARVYRARLETTGPELSGRAAFMNMDYASPIVADDKIYFPSRRGDVQVIQTGDEFVELAVNRVTSEPDDFSSTPAVSDGMLFLRSDKHLYCLASMQPDEEVEPLALAAAEASSDAADRRPGDGGRDGGRSGEARPGGSRPGGGRPGGGGPGGGGGFDPAAMFRNMDRNDDGKLTGDEIVGPMRDGLDRIDGDGDGAVTRDEFMTAMRRGGGGGGGGGVGNRGYRDPRRGRDEDRPQRPPWQTPPPAEESGD